LLIDILLHRRLVDRSIDRSVDPLADPNDMRKIPVPDIQAMLIDALETLPDKRKESHARTRQVVARASLVTLLFVDSFRLSFRDVSIQLNNISLVLFVRSFFVR
jgi:hypothetical protein